MQTKIILVIVSAVLLVVLAGVLGYQKLIQPTETTPIVVEQPVVQTKDEAVGWKTYKNEKRGIEFRYPNSWILDDVETLADQTKGFIQINVSSGIGLREDESVSRYTTISSIADKNDDKLVINQILATFKFAK